MRDGTAPLIRREDYAPPAFWIKQVDLSFDLDPAKTLVMSRLTSHRRITQKCLPIGQSALCRLLTTQRTA